MKKTFDIYKLKFIKENDIIEEVKDGYSGALLYKITRNESNFFLKIFNGKLTKKEKKKIKNCISIYKKLNIKSLSIIDMGNISNSDNYYIVYNFIEGINLKEYTKINNFSPSDIRKFGEKIGQELLKLKNYKDYNIELFISEKIEDLVETTINNFDLLLNNNLYKNIILEYFDTKELNQLKSKLIEYYSFLKNVPQNLIHGDIKRANIMVNENKEFYITDIESMQVNYDVLNFRYQITWSLFEGSEKEYEFVNGYFNGIYDGRRPKDFNYHIIFIIILNFFTESYHRYKHSNINGLREYVEKCQKLFSKINKMNLDKDLII